jgi:hypothetical protein
MGTGDTGYPDGGGFRDFPKSLQVNVDIIRLLILHRFLPGTLQFSVL